MQLAIEDRADEHAAIEETREERRAELAFGGGVNRASTCVESNIPLSGIDPDRSLFVHDKATLDGADFSLRRTLQQLADQAVLAGADAAVTTAETMFEKLWADQVPVAPATTCPDATGLINDYPYHCREEGDQAAIAATEIDNYFPVALVNRLDLASEDWGDCGEHRIVYARTPDGTDENFVIFEAVLPNPRPGCQESCRAIAIWWAALSLETDPLVRAGLLEELYYRPGGAGPKGFRPVVHFDHYSEAGVDTNKLTSIGGQIRTNQRVQTPWVLKENKTALDCSVQPCLVDIVPISVGLNPFGLPYDSNEEFTGQTWSANVSSFQADFLAQRDLLAAGTSAIDFTYAPSSEANAAESPVTNTDSDYFALTHATFMADIETAAPVGFTGEQLTNRATALNCAGCHDPSKFGLTLPDAVGPGLSFHDSLRFVHTADVVTPALLPATTHFGTGDGFELSPALIDAFLPARADNLVTQLNQKLCVCQPAAPLLSREGREESDMLAREAAADMEAAMECGEPVEPILAATDQAMLDLLARHGFEHDACQGQHDRRDSARARLDGGHPRHDRLRQGPARPARSLHPPLTRPASNVRRVSTILIPSR